MSFNYIRDVVLNYVMSNNGCILSKRIMHLTKRHNIYNYLLHKYKDDTDDIKLILSCMKNNIYEFPKCPVCGKKLKPLCNFGKRMFSKHCSERCSTLDKNVQEKSKCTNKKLYGEEYFFQTKLFKDKAKSTNIKLFGVDAASKSEKIKEKIASTKLIKYGNKKYNNVDKCKKTCLDKYGVDNVFRLPQNHDERTNALRLETRKKSGNFGSTVSNIEYKILDYIKEKFPDAIHQYKSRQYPFTCDFYVPSIDTYIEYQGSQFHHFHAYDPQNIDDINELIRMQKLMNDHPQYAGIIDTWTKFDPNKRNIAKENNVKLIEIWPKDDYKEIIDNLKGDS